MAPSIAMPAASDQEPVVGPARILFGELPRTMREILSAEMMLHADVQVVGQCANVDLAAEIDRVMPNVIIVGRVDDTDDGPHLRWLGLYREVKVVVIMDERRGASVHHQLDDPSPATLVQAVRGALQSVGVNAH
jgi:hypothetical protein